MSRSASSSAPPPLSAAGEALVQGHDVGLFDLDGVVYVGDEPVAGAPEALGRVRELGMKVRFVTNNASRTPDAVSEHLQRVGVPATAADVVTSAQAAAHLVADRVPAGSRVLVVGGEGLSVALSERGLVPVFSATDAPAAVVQGFHPDVGWRQLAEGAYALASDLPWIASNVDRTLPTDDGLAPGNGALVEVIRIATGRSPLVAGKPEPPLFLEAVVSSGADRPLVIGDRLDTDIEGAHKAGLPSLLVLTGVTSLVDLATAPPHRRPTYLSRDLDGMFVPHPSPVVGPDGTTCGGWRVELESQGADTLQPRLTGDGDPLDAARAVLAAMWARGDPARVDAAEVLEGLEKDAKR
ncbi:HAD-IIA family hydrolase [Actinopolymorpha sp. B17G11]|uniref:HAD-IIA family hydrolase n=1 Tax=unclassified Actinopolymorpha TaxID=2627063 RepID=UPI0032D943FE